MAKVTDEAAVQLKLERAKQFKDGMKAAGKSVRQLGKDASWTAARSKIASKSLDSLRSSATFFGRTAVRGFQTASFAVGAFGLYALKTGVQFNATMQQNQIAFTQFLGSAKAAREELATLYQIAKTTPFSFADVTMATRKFLAFGFSAKQANGLLRTVADTASGLALDAGGIDRMVMAIGQIKSKGTLSMEDLRQLQELGAVNVGQLAKDLGLTRKEMANVGKEQVPATKALKALKKQWDKTFGGMSAKQANTLTGQWSTLKDNWAQLTGAMTSGATNPIVNMLKVANGEMSKLVAVWQHKGWDFQRKLQVSKHMVWRLLKPYADQARDALRRAHLGDRIGEAVEDAAPKVADAMARSAPVAAGAFIHAFMAMGPWGKFLTLAFLGQKMGVFGALGRMAAARMALQWKTSLGPAMKKAGMRNAMTSLGTSWGGVFGRAFALSAAAPIVADVWSNHIEGVASSPAEQAFEARARAQQERHRDLRDALPTSPKPKGTRRLPETVSRPGRGDAMVPRVEVTSRIYLDSTEVGHRMMKKARNNARRRR